MAEGHLAIDFEGQGELVRPDLDSKHAEEGEGHLAIGLQHAEGVAGGHLAMDLEHAEAGEAGDAHLTISLEHFEVAEGHLAIGFEGQGELVSLDLDLEHAEGEGDLAIGFERPVDLMGLDLDLEHAEEAGEGQLAMVFEET